jgi:hypothetical protein
VAALVDWFNHRHRHGGFRLITPHQQHSGQEVAISKQQAKLYEQARQGNPRRWIRTSRCWCKPNVVWINEPHVGCETGHKAGAELPLQMAA